MRFSERFLLAVSFISITTYAGIPPQMAIDLTGDWARASCKGVNPGMDLLRISAINAGKDIAVDNVIYNQGGGETIGRGFTTIFERVSKVNPLMADAFMVTTTETSELNNQIAVAAITKSDAPTKFLSAYVTRLTLSQDKKRLTYERDGYTVQVPRGPGTFSVSCEFAKK